MKTGFSLFYDAKHTANKDHTAEAIPKCEIFPESLNIGAPEGHRCDSRKVNYINGY
jgi:hypothetical protein